MYLLDWLLIKTPDGATYLQVILIFIVLFLLVKYFVLPELEEIQNIWKSLFNEDTDFIE